MTRFPIKVKVEKTKGNGVEVNKQLKKIKIKNQILQLEKGEKKKKCLEDIID